MTSVNIHEKKKIIGNFYDKKKEKIIREGVRNRERIFRCILENRVRGVMLHDISNNVNLSRQATNEHLIELLNEERIRKNKQRRYFPTDSVYNSVLTFAHQMLDAQQDMIDMIEPKGTRKKRINSIPRQELYQYPGFSPMIVSGFARKNTEFEPTPRDYLREALSQLTLSEDFCKVHFDEENKYEKFLFEIANRLGAYITYIFIQSLYHIPDYVMVDGQDRKKLSLILVDEAINLFDLFDSFRYNLSKLGLINIKDLDINKMFELDENDYDKISTAFKNIYPNLFRGFENYWYHPQFFWLQLDTDLSKNNGCNHKWEQNHIFKFGDYSYCRKCHLYRRDNDNK